MSKKKINTKDKILAKALEMFNEKGIEYVGLRELAAILDIRVSNITYYFPTKDDLVNSLSTELNQLNSGVMTEDMGPDLKTFLANMEKVFHHQLKYRCLLLSVVHLVSQNKIISARHKQTQRDRNQIFNSNIRLLTERGFLQFKKEEESGALIAQLGMFARFWLSEAAISYQQFKGEEQIRYYLQLYALLLKPYATERGREELQKFFE